MARTGIIGSIIKEFKGGPVEIGNTMGNSRSASRDRNPFPDPSKDDIKIDDTVSLPSSSTAASTVASISRHNKRGEATEKEKLLGKRADTVQPRKRTPQEIIACYSKAGVVSGAEQARNKLAERQEKLQHILLTVRSCKMQSFIHTR